MTEKTRMILHVSISLIIAILLCLGIRWLYNSPDEWYEEPYDGVHEYEGQQEN